MYGRRTTELGDLPFSPGSANYKLDGLEQLLSSL